jgi:hypothetical protein
MTTATETRTGLADRRRTILEIEATGSLVAAAAGSAVVVLSIIGLVHDDAIFLASICAIVIGAALLAQGGAITAEYSRILSMITGGAVGAVELGGGATVEVIAGGAGVVLGILGLLGLAPETLLACAVVVVGAALILTASGLQRLSALKLQVAGVSELAQRVAHGAAASTIGAQALAGGAGVVLGVIALTLTQHAGILTLVGFLTLGTSIVISGAALSGKQLLELLSIN